MSGITINEELCDACGSCAEICATEAITIEKVAKVDADKCIECGACVTECPHEAIELEIVPYSPPQNEPLPRPVSSRTSPQYSGPQRASSASQRASSAIGGFLGAIDTFQRTFREIRGRGRGDFSGGGSGRGMGGGGGRGMGGGGGRGMGGGGGRGMGGGGKGMGRGGKGGS